MNLLGRVAGSHCCRPLQLQQPGESANFLDERGFRHAFLADMGCLFPEEKMFPPSFVLVQADCREARRYLVLLKGRDNTTRETESVR